MTDKQLNADEIELIVEKPGVNSVENPIEVKDVEINREVDTDRLVGVGETGQLTYSGSMTVEVEELTPDQMIKLEDFFGELLTE